MIILLIIITLATFLPQLWVRWVISHHHKEIDDMPGTGAELARHLLSRFEMEGFVVEQTEPMRDHYAPNDKAVRLSPKVFSGKSLSAIAIATHEVGHAIQHHRQENIFTLRTRYLPLAKVFTDLGLWALRLTPLLIPILKSPAIIGVVVGLGLLLQLIGALIHLIVLPEEWDASFNKALPILIEGEYISDQQVPAVNKVLKAAALTYFAGSLANILNISRLFLLFRR